MAMTARTTAPMPPSRGLRRRRSQPAVPSPTAGPSSSTRHLNLLPPFPLYTHRLLVLSAPSRTPVGCATRSRRHPSDHRLGFRAQMCNYRRLPAPGLPPIPGGGKRRAVPPPAFSALSAEEDDDNMYVIRSPIFFVCIARVSCRHLPWRTHARMTQPCMAHHPRRAPLCQSR